jgi:hypothetical protein
LEKSELAVGDSTALEIIFSTKRYNKSITKRPRIQTNEGPPDKNVTIIANVIQRPDSTFPVVVKPYKLDISQFGERVRDKMKFTITNVSEQDVTLAMIADLPGLADIELPEKIGAGKSVGRHIRLHADKLEEEFEKSFTFETSGEVTQRFTVPVKRTVKKPTAAGDAAGKGAGGKR